MRIFKEITFNLTKIKSKIGLIKIKRMEKNTLINTNTYSFNLPSKCIFMEDIVFEVSLFIKKCHINGIIKKYVINVLRKQKKYTVLFTLFIKITSLIYNPGIKK